MASAETQTDVELDGLLNRLVSLADEAGSAFRAKGSPEPPADLQQIRSLLRDEELITSANSGPAELEPRFKADGGFFPVAPRTFAEAHVSESHVETIILRLLSLRGALKGVEIAQQIFFPFSLAEKVLQALENPTPGSSQKRRYVERFHLRAHGSGRQQDPPEQRAKHLLR